MSSAQRYFVRLAYRGTHYRGWQRQPNDLPTVQQTIEETLSEVLRTPTTVVGCGRTDAGVHASDYYLHFAGPPALRPNFVPILNHRLPQDIRFLEAYPVARTAHARYDATARTYRYRLHTRPDPLANVISCYLPPGPLDVAAIHRAASFLPGHHDFRALCLTPDRHPTTDCTFTEATFDSSNPDRPYFQFTANRFLRGMIRLLVWQLLAVGRGELKSAEVVQALRTGVRLTARQAPPEGLTLTKVVYGEGARTRVGSGAV